MKLFLISILIGGWFSTASGQTIYVSPAGNDRASGTKDSPVATLRGARDKVRHLKSITQASRSSITVLVGEGTYHLNTPLELDETDGGTSEFPVIWRGEAGKEIRLNGGASLPVEDFKPVTDPDILKRIPETAAPHVRYVNLTDLGIRDWGSHTKYGHSNPVTVAPLELFVNDTVMQLARYPNEGYIPLGPVVDPGSVPRTGDHSERGGIFRFTDPRHLRWKDSDDIWLKGTFNYGFADDNIGIEYINPKDSTVKLSSPHLYGLRSGAAYQHYYAYNILEELDVPGEWYLDRKTGNLYLWPEKPLTSSTLITVSILEQPLICMEGVSNLNFENFVLEAGRNMGIYSERCHNTVIAGCTIRNMGTAGIFMGQGAKQLMDYLAFDSYDGVPRSRFIGSTLSQIYKYTQWNRHAGSENTILSCDIYGTGTGGIYLGGGDKSTLTDGNNLVENCRITDYNRRNKFCWAGINVDGCGNKIRHNEIFGSEWQGIFVRGNEHVFEYNDLHHLTTNSDDTSPWYIGRDPSDRGHIIRYNYIHHCGNPDRMTMGIYCDDSSTGVEVYGNIFYKMATNCGMLFSNTGWDLSFRNNIVIEPNGSSVYISNHFNTWAQKEGYEGFKTTGGGGYIRNRLEKNIDIHSDPYAGRYPSLKEYLLPIVPEKEWEGHRCRNIVASGNLIVKGPENPLFLTGTYASCEWIENYHTQKDPGFADYEHGDFNLRSDSEVFGKIKGFEPLPHDRMGLYPDRFRKPR